MSIFCHCTIHSIVGLFVYHYYRIHSKKTEQNVLLHFFRYLWVLISLKFPVSESENKCHILKPEHTMKLERKLRFQRAIKIARNALTAEKRKLGYIIDEKQNRYIPLHFYIKLQDFKGGLAYAQWYDKNFPEEIAFPDFMFEWAVMLFENDKTREAKKKIIETFFGNTYLLDKLFGRPIPPYIEKEVGNVVGPEFTETFVYSSNQPELVRFAAWLLEFEQSEEFKSITKRFTDAKIRLEGDLDPETRQYLSKYIERDLLNEI